MADDDYQPTTTDFLKTPVPVSDSVDAEWGPWDSGKPMDWSKPAFEKETVVTHGETIK